jgi:flagellar motor component MotA
MRVKTGIFLGMVSLLLAAILRGGGIDIRQMILFINIPSALLPALGVIASMLVNYAPADIMRNFKTCRLVRRNKIIIDEETARGLALFYDSLGVYSIAWGVIITVVGFILMAANLYDTAQLASGFAIAILSVYYGLIAAYLVFFPLSRKFRIEWKKP